MIQEVTAVDRDQQQKRGRGPVETVGEGVRQAGGHVSAGTWHDHQRHALKDRHGRERRQDRRQTQPDDEQAVACARERRRAKRQGDRAKDARREGERRDGAGDAHHRPQGQVDPIGHDNKELPQRDERQRQDVHAEGLQIERAEMAALQRKVNHEQREEGCDRANGALARMPLRPSGTAILGAG